MLSETSEWPHLDLISESLLNATSHHISGGRKFPTTRPWRRHKHPQSVAHCTLYFYLFLLLLRALFPSAHLWLHVNPPKFQHHNNCGGQHLWDCLPGLEVLPIKHYKNKREESSSTDTVTGVLTQWRGLLSGERAWYLCRATPLSPSSSSV